jgi:glycosyltransferase involved in cell wall biosynthesis
MKLSILICSLTERAHQLPGLLETLDEQIMFPEDVEVLVELDNRERTTGAKRNTLLDKAKGDYVCFVDDDDMVCDRYVDWILTAIESKPDVVGMIGQLRHAGDTIGTFIHSIRYTDWVNDEAHRLYTRCPNHLNPVRRDLACAARFPDVTRFEDRAYSEALRGKLLKEVMIELPIYFYNV